MITRRLFAIAAAASLTVGASAQAQTPEEFFEGRTIRVISSTGAGGTMDLYLLLFMKYAERHLPSGTTMVLDHRTGGGGAIMANYMYNQANNDGTEIGMPVPALVSSTFSTPDATRYDPSEFGVLGRLVDNPRVFVARAETGFETLEDMANAESETTHGIMTVGASFDQFMRVANESLGTNFRPVAGYSGGGPTFLALEQGEVMSTTAEPANLLANKWHLVESGDINVLGYLGLEPIPGLEAYP
ncbi:MAG: tripartite tricarboxylate transporter substrate-binding protein, partial [Pararhodobacter sp.]